MPPRKPLGVVSQVLKTSCHSPEPLPTLYFRSRIPLPVSNGAADVLAADFFAVVEEKPVTRD
ncbi:MAG: hypothetical protein KBG73_00415 [Candidatus Promineofilum sp.]|jgi:hypothetical protein|nr:hypothetical protein [Promineifilum sp.]